MSRISRLHRPTAPPSDPPSASVPTSSVQDAQAPSISIEIPPLIVEEGGEEEDMDLDDDASMISRVHPSGSDVTPDSDQEDSSALPLSPPFPWKMALPFRCSLHGRTLLPYT